MKKAFLLLVSILTIEGCVTIHPAVQSRLFAVQGGQFTQAYPEVDQLKYFLALNVKNPPDQAIYLDVQYENPCDRRAPISETRILEPKQDKVLLESPPLLCVKDHRYYYVRVTAYDSAEKSHRIDQLTQKIYATLNSRKLSNSLHP